MGILSDTGDWLREALGLSEDGNEWIQGDNSQRNQSGRITVIIHADHNAKLFFSLTDGKIEFTACSGFSVSDDGKRVMIKSTNGRYTGVIGYSGSNVSYTHTNEMETLLVTLATERKVDVGAGIHFLGVTTDVNGKLVTATQIKE